MHFMLCILFPVNQGCGQNFLRFLHRPHCLALIFVQICVAYAKINSTIPWGVNIDVSRKLFYLFLKVLESIF